jgi:hypothetical protein
VLNFGSHVFSFPPRSIGTLLIELALSALILTK